MTPASSSRSSIVVTVSSLRAGISSLRTVCVMGAERWRRSRLPGVLPRSATLELQCECPAEKGTDQHDHSEDADTPNGWGNGNRANNISGNEHFKSEQQRPPKSFAVQL